MNCFQWNHKSSDFLDETLTSAEQKDIETHLKGCLSCSSRSEHFKEILSTIAQHPKVSLPEPLREAPLSSPLPRLTPSQSGVSTWERLPWYIRTLIESLGMIGVILIGVSSAPKLKIFYEEKVETSLTDLKESIRAHSEPGLDENDPNLPKLQEKTLSEPVDASEEISGEDEDRSDDSIHVGKSQLWRFSIKTVSPDELRPQIVRLLTQLKIPPETPGLGGIQVPGGIEFDLILPTEIIPEIKSALEKLTTPSHDSAQTTPGLEPFTWYKIKSRRKVPTGKAQVMIWLSQPN